MTSTRQYYEKVFPSKEVANFLQRHATRPLNHREIALCWLIKGSVKWQRFNCYNAPENMAQDLTRRNPYGVYCGPVYNVKPSARYIIGPNLVPVAHRLIFDVDATDYDDIRECDCPTKKEGVRVCKRCWPLIGVALIVIRYLLRYKFGLHEALLTFSGSKGGHVWILDKDVQTYTDNTRTNIAAYFYPFRDPQRMHAIPLQCPVLARCYEQVIKPYFEGHILGNVLSLQTTHALNLVRACIAIHEPELSTEFIKLLPVTLNENKRWHQLQTLIMKHTVDGLAIIRSFVLMCCYPRLDKSITTSMQHLIRLIFSVNGKGGKICLPIRYQDIFSFNPETPPTVHTIQPLLPEYIRILEETLLAPWKQLWVCRVCERGSDPYQFHDTNIFLSKEDWTAHHYALRHDMLWNVDQCTAKMIAQLKYPEARTEWKKFVYVTLLKIKTGW